MRVHRHVLNSAAKRQKVSVRIRAAAVNKASGVLPSPVTRSLCTNAGSSALELLRLLARANSGSRTLNAEHLAQLQRGAPDLTQGPDDALGVGLGQEGAGVQHALLVFSCGKRHQVERIFGGHVSRSTVVCVCVFVDVGQWVGRRRVSGPVHVGVSVLPAVPVCLMVFLATSASAPNPKPTARPGGDTHQTTQRRNTTP